MKGDVETYYDKFSRKFIDDIVLGNERIKQQLQFFSRALPRTVRSVLVVGCGSGQGAHHIATAVSTRARILAIDISSESLKLAKSVFAHPRIEYRQVDVIEHPLSGEWEAIVLPDVYEHIPKAARTILHERFNRLLTPNGRILFTIPSPGKQASLFKKDEGLQIVDEVVTLEDLNVVAKEIGGALAYFSLLSVWETNDYIHAVIERGTEPVRPINEEDELPIKGRIPRNLRHRLKDALGHRFGLFRLHEEWNRRRISRRIPG